MAPKEHRRRSDHPSAEATAAWRADQLAEPRWHTSSRAEDVLPGPEEAPSGSALLIVTRGPNAGARFLLEGRVASAGRDRGSDIFLDDITVSRRHAEFRCEDSEFRIVDVGSLNGTYVNRQPVDSAVLTHHDEIQIGKFRLVFLTAPTTR